MDFSSLNGLKNGARKIFLWSIILTALVSFCFLMYAAGDTSRAPLTVAVVLLFISISAWTYRGLKRERSYNNGLLAQFATTNHWKFTPGSNAGSFEKGSGSLFRVQGAHTPVVRYVLEGTVSGLPASLFGYDYATGSGKDRAEHRTTVMRLVLPRVLPQMVIDSLVEGGSNDSSVLPIAFDQSQRIVLEGEFSKYFSCYAPSGYGVTLLTIIGPDAMLTLMQCAAACDIEIIDNSIYFYWPARANTREGYEHIFTTADAVMKELGRKLIKSDIYKTSDQASLHSTTQTEGVRLAKPQTRPLAVVICLIGMAGVVAGFSWLGSKHPGALLVSIALIVVVSVVFAMVSRRRTKDKFETLRREFPR